MKDYIVLSGQEATVEGDYLAWDIPPDYFMHWKHNDDVYIRLSNCNFTGNSSIAGTSLTLAQAVVEGDMISAQNQKSTYERIILSIAPVAFQGDENGGTVFSNNASANNPQYKTDRFQKIRMAVNYFDEYMNIQVYRASFVAVFEIEYVKPQPKN